MLDREIHARRQGEALLGRLGELDLDVVGVLARAASPAVASVGFSSRNWLELNLKRRPLPSSQLEERRSVIMALPPWFVICVTNRMFCV